MEIPGPRRNGKTTRYPGRISARGKHHAVHHGDRGRVQEDDEGKADAIKDVGGYVAGHLKNGRRKVGHVICRSMLTLDMDNGMPMMLS